MAVTVMLMSRNRLATPLAAVTPKAYRSSDRCPVVSHLGHVRLASVVPLEEGQGGQSHPAVLLIDAAVRRSRMYPAEIGTG